MRRTITLTMAFVLGFFSFALAQTTTITGYVSDSKTNEPLSGVHIEFPKLNKSSVSNRDGAFSINIPNGTHKMQVMSMGYQGKTITVKTSKANKPLYIGLVPSITGLKEVEIARNKLKRSGEATARLDVPLKDIPMTVSSVDKSILEQTQVYNVNDALRYTTGVKPTVNYGGFQTFKFRGLGRPVIMVDGARDERMNFSNSAPVTSLAAVERIEFLKGPASVLYGHSVDGGILNIIRKQPTKDFTANFSAYYGSWDNKGAVVGAGGKLSDKVNYRFDASIGDQQGWRDFAQKTNNAYFAVDYNINENNKLEFRLGGNDDFYATETGFPIFRSAIFDANNDQKVYDKGDLVDGFDRSQRYNDPQDFLKHKNINGSVKYIHTFANKSKLSYHASYAYDFIDYFSTESLNFPTADTAIYGHYFMKNGAKKYIDIHHITRDYPFRFAHETKTAQSYLDYSIKFNTGSLKHNLLVGGFGMVLDRVTFKGYDANDIFGPGKYATVSVVNPVLNQGYLGEKFSAGSVYHEVVSGLYAQDLLEITPKLKALAALRIDRYQMDYQTAEVHFNKELLNHSETKTIVNMPLSYRLGLVYEPIETMSVYASYSNFFRPKRSTFNPNYIYINKDGNRFYPEDGKQVFKPETGYQAEIGVKYSRSKKVQFNASAYYINKENIVEYLGEVTTSDSIQKKVYGQVGMVDSKGFELDMVYTPIKGLSITAGYTYSQAKYKQFADNEYVKDNNREGNFLVRNPKNQFFLWSFYQMEEGMLKGLNLGFGVNYTDVMYTHASNTYELPSYWLTEAAIGYKMNDNIYCKFKINNILNQEYFSNSVFSSQFIPGQERNYLFTIGYKL